MMVELQSTMPANITPRQRQASKFLSLILRHDPTAAGVTLDPHGWINIDELLTGMATAGMSLRRAELEQIVRDDSKSRYSIDADRIRANQGHSLPVDLGLEPRTPPDALFHGTAQRFLDSIREGGLVPGQRQHVHLSTNIDTARAVGQRHGKPVILVVDTVRMHTDGHVFLLSDNDVWLTEHVPPSYLTVEPQHNGT
jgi:putative RNA 2'-phosphotransferase